MKLFIHDKKHEKINSELDLGELTEKEKQLIEKIAQFLEDNHITNRYRRLVLAENVAIEYDPESHEPEVIFGNRYIGI